MLSSPPSALSEYFNEVFWKFHLICLKSFHTISQEVVQFFLIILSLIPQRSFAKVRSSFKMRFHHKFFATDLNGKSMEWEFHINYGIMNFSRIFSKKFFHEVFPGFLQCSFIRCLSKMLLNYFCLKGIPSVLFQNISKILSEI